jgi:hypothetical protein
MRVPTVGAWRSLVAHLHGVQGVGGSNPLAPTNTYAFLRGPEMYRGTPRDTPFILGEATT